MANLIFEMKTKKVSFFVLCGFISLIHCDDSLYRCPNNLPRDRYLRVHGEKCYRFITSEGSWFSARDHCSRTGGALITITRRDIQLFVEGVLREIWSRNGMWIGAHDRDTEMNWKWITGQSVSSTYTNWDSGQPSCFLPKFLCHEDCACLRVDEGYKWHDYLCGSDLYEYGFACQYDLLPPMTTTQRILPPSPLVLSQQPTEKPTTTTTSTTTATTTTASKTTTLPEIKSTESQTMEPDIKISMEKEKNLLELGSLSDVDRSDSQTLSTPVNVNSVESQRLADEESSMKTGGLVGLVVSFILVFIAGLIAGVLICKRRYRKRYSEENLCVGFNNVLYTAAPVCETQSKVKDTNLQAASAAEDSGEEETDHRYVDIDELGAHCSPCVKLPPCKESYEPIRVSCVKENLYDTVQSEEEEASDPDEQTPPPPPCPGMDKTQFAPEFLKKDTNVFQAYNNNLYGHHG